MAFLCVRLGVWQLHRLAARRAYNHVVASRRAQAPVPLDQIPRDSLTNRYRRVQFSGTYDFAHEIVLVGRIRDGAPGVDLLTPVHPGGALGDTAVLVDRGWVYAADAMSVDEEQWREPIRLLGSGYVTGFVAGRGPSTLSTPDRPNEVRWVDRAAIEQRTGYPIASYMIVLDASPNAPASSSARADSGGPPVRAPARIAPPALDEGPHLSYAIQWFSFAVIAVVGPAWALFIGPRRTRGQQPAAGGQSPT
jgi:surfeit locus 1 family protein